jgi:hypothetical protein
LGHPVDVQLDGTLILLGRHLLRLGLRLGKVHLAELLARESRELIETQSPLFLDLSIVLVNIPQIFDKNLKPELIMFLMKTLPVLNLPLLIDLPHIREDLAILKERESCNACEDSNQSKDLCLHA